MPRDISTVIRSRGTLSVSVVTDDPTSVEVLCDLGVPCAEGGDEVHVDQQRRDDVRRNLLLFGGCLEVPKPFKYFYFTPRIRSQAPFRDQAGEVLRARGRANIDCHGGGTKIVRVAIGGDLTFPERAVGRDVDVFPPIFVGRSKPLDKELGAKPDGVIRRPFIVCATAAPQRRRCAGSLRVPVRVT
jgi:hypothetical protein